MSTKILDVYFNEQLVGELVQAEHGYLQFSYSDQYLRLENPNPISVVMPLQHQKFDDNITRPFFSGLLPDEDKRKNLAHYLHVSEKNPFSLLAEVGGECAGALSLYPHDTIPEAVADAEVITLTDERLIEILGLLSKRPLLAGEEGMRLSLAGVQDKLPVLVIKVEGGEKVALTNGPTSHILKPSIPGFEYSVHNEFFCMNLAHRMGLPIPRVHLHRVDGIDYFVVDRYDRVKVTDSTYLRLHQEDFCQAMSIVPEKKYESEGGPNFKRCFDLVRDFSYESAKDIKNLIFLVVFNYLIGNADAHAKNMSLLYTDQGIVLAPFYDLLCTSVYSGLGDKMAMKIGGKYGFKDVYLRHWENFAHKVGISVPMLKQVQETFSREILTSAKDLSNHLNSDERSASPIYEEIIKVIERHIKYLGR